MPIIPRYTRHAIERRIWNYVDHLQLRPEYKSRSKYFALIAELYGVNKRTVDGIFKQMANENRLGGAPPTISASYHSGTIAQEAKHTAVATATTTTTPMDFATLSQHYDAAAPLHATAMMTTTQTMDSRAEDIDAPFGRAVAASTSSSKLLAAATPPTSKNNNPRVHELVLDPDEYETFQQDPYLYLGIENRDSVELDIEIIDKR